MKKFLWIIIFNLFFTTNIFAADRTINLVVGYKTINFAGKYRKAIAVNNQIPAPTLHFKEGDQVNINVYNHLDKDTAIHWHGVLVPWQMDGVEGITQKSIPPGGVFHYKFTLQQSGTYWYHAHAGLQEQQGLYGAFLIDPPKAPPYKYTKDFVVVLSDWSNTAPEQILANLKKEGDYYSPRFPLQPSLAKFIHDYRKASTEEKQNLIDDYKMMQQMRMSIYDISDVAYDAFLINGQPKSTPWTASVKVGDVVRLRFIGAGGSTIFHVKIPNANMQMVHVEGNDVEPYTIKDFRIAPGETYDVLVKIQKNEPYVIYAESIDTVGAAYGALVTSPYQFVNYEQVTPFPEPLPVTREMMSMMMGGMNHGSESMNMTMNSSSSSKGKNQTNSAHSMHHGMKMQNSQTMNMNSSSNSMGSMKMDPGMKMNDDMPMNHSMSMGAQKSITKTTTDKKSKSDAMKMDAFSSSHSMQMKSKPSHKMDSMSEESMGNMSHSHMHTMSNQMKMSDGIEMDQGMTMNHSMSMSMPTEPTIIGDKFYTSNSLHTKMKMDSDILMKHSMSHTMTMSQHDMSSEFTTAGTKYENLIAAVKTNDPNKPVDEVIKMELFGYMDRFIWFINGVPGHEAHPILLEPGKRYRIIFTNTSMMHHPMHIHGHWFILRKGNGAYDPLLHTIDVPPGATITADIDADASGQWFFHCHLLYHMMTGMSRVFQYSTFIEITKEETKPQDIVKQTSYHNRPIVRVDEVRPIDLSLVKHPMAHPAGLYLSNFLDVGADPFHNAQRLTFKGLYGPDYNKLELFTNDAEVKKGTVENADVDIFYWHLISQFWAVKGGASYFYRPAMTPYWQPGIGIEGLMPYFIDTDVRGYFHNGSAKLDVELSRDTQITNNFFIRAGIRSILASKTVTQDAVGSGLNQMRYIVRPFYRLMPGLNVFAEYEHEQDYGAFRHNQINAGESATQNTLTFGLTILF
ncbi:MAG: multicopper oxidase domain-containing protein [Gammaproteobacteria bacterium]